MQKINPEAYVMINKISHVLLLVFACMCIEGVFILYYIDKKDINSFIILNGIFFVLVFGMVALMVNMYYSDDYTPKKVFHIAEFLWLMAFVNFVIVLETLNNTPLTSSTLHLLSPVIRIALYTVIMTISVMSIVLYCFVDKKHKPTSN